MFASQAVKSLLDLSQYLSHPTDWDTGLLKTIPYHLDITAVTTEPISGILAVGTAKGTIHLYGSPGVECHLELPNPPGLRVKYLHFAVSTFKLLCIDQSDRLLVWDLTNPGRPLLQKITRFNHPVQYEKPISSYLYRIEVQLRDSAITTSPSHTHAFAALANGEIKAYDLLCLRISQYSIPNLWKMYQEIALSQYSPIVGASQIDIILDILMHPRNLNLLLVAYEGGVMVTDLKEQKPVRTFELILPPGAPGAAGYYTKDILLPRRQSVTALAIHPTGHLVAIGYADGTIGFWCLDDEDRPLVLRTVDSPEGEDLSTVDPEKLDTALGQKDKDSQHLTPPREPIFKLAWSGFPNSSDPRGGDTVLTISGGLVVGSHQGLTTILFPPLQPPAPRSPTTSPNNNEQRVSPLHAETRAAICSSLAAKNTYFYSAAGPVQDFILFPRSSPHFSGTYDPSTILILSDSEVADVRICEAYEFPPPSFVERPDPTPTPKGATVDPEDDSDNELSKTLQEMDLMFSDDPRPATLPPPLWSVLDQDLVKLQKRSYDTLAGDNALIDGEIPFPLKGGIAWIEDEGDIMKRAKYEPRRVLISRLHDLSVRFLDLSTQLLISTGPDMPRTANFPSPLPRLTIELIPILIDYTLGLTGSTQYEEQLTKYRIDAVHFGRESLECVTVLSSQAVILHWLDVPADTRSPVRQTLADKELISLAHIKVRKGLRYTPVVAVKPDKAHGTVTSCALSDIGFLAVAYSSGVLLVVDLRGPRVILRADSASHKGSFLHRHEVEPIQALTWTCCALETDQTSRIRLICTAASGKATIYMLDRNSTRNWAVSGNPVIVDSSARPLPHGSFVLDAKSGAQSYADRSALSAITDPVGHEAERKHIWVSVGEKGARCVVNLNGERIAKADFGSKAGRVVNAEIVEQFGSCALVVYTHLGHALTYTLPHLELVSTVQVSPSGFSSPPSTDDSGDYIMCHWVPASAGSAFRPILSTELHTHFPRKRAGAYRIPIVDLEYGRGPIPSQPQPVSLGPPSMMSSVLGFIGSITAASTAGSEIDALLAGPDRPVPDAKPAQTTEKSSIAPSQQQSSMAATTAGMSSGVTDLYNRLGTALSERSERLSDIQQTIDSVERGSRDMLAQAKRIAYQQSAKHWFGF